MKGKQEIIFGHFRMGKGIKQLHRELGYSPNTIRKYIRSYKSQHAQLGMDGVAIPESGVIDPPRYDSSKRVKTKLTDEIRRQLDEMIADNKLKEQKGRHKQKLYKTDMHEVLVDRGYQIGYSTVQR